MRRPNKGRPETSRRPGCETARAEGVSLGTTLLFFVLLLPAVACGSATKGDKPQEVGDVHRPDPPARVTEWVAGLEIPWGLVFLGNGTALVTERPGRIRRIEDGRLVPEPYAEVDVAAVGEGGLMGITLHPAFPDPPYLYIMYTRRGADGLSNRVDRYRHGESGGAFDRVIVEGIPGGRYHDGGRIAFGPDGMLHIATGETFDRDLAQDRNNLAGKILRVTPEGDVPEDNPFPGSPVYSYGHRNPQGLAWDPATGALFASEHGPSGEVGFGAYDEINRIQAGGNYGWPEVVGAPGMNRFVDPLLTWPETTTPPSGMTFFGGDLFVATLGSEALLRIGFDREKGHRATRIERWFSSEDGRSRYGRLRDVVEGPDGALYLLTSNRDGRGRPRPGDDRILRMELE